MSTWNYQILIHKENGEDYYSVHEVYRDASGKIMACTDGLGVLPSETSEELISKLKMMLKDCEHYPTHEYMDVPEEGAEELGGERDEKVITGE